MSAPAPAPLRRHLVRLAPEVTTKSRRTRRRFQDRLTANLENALAGLGGAYHVRNRWDRIHVEAEHPGAAERIAGVFGVSSVSRVDDTTAYETMLRYHRLLAGGLDSPTALAEALDGDVDLPAPFVCFGSPWSVAS